MPGAQEGVEHPVPAAPDDGLEQPVAPDTPMPPRQPHPATPPVPKKKRGCLVGCLSAIGLVVVLVVGILGWLGFVPGLSRAIGPKPRDLGVEWSVGAAYECSDAFDIPDTVSDLQMIEVDPAAFDEFDAQLTSEQASSLLLMGQDGIPNWPLEFVQLRFNEDGTAEASGVLDFEELTPFLTDNLGVPQDSVAEAIDRVMLVSDTTFYVKGTAGVQNNAVSMSLSEIQLGRFTVPGGWYQGKEHVGAEYISGALDREGFAVENVTLGSGAVSAKGTRPPSSLMPWLDIVRDDRVEG
jgi:hypothetical protein